MEGGQGVPEAQADDIDGLHHKALQIQAALPQKTPDHSDGAALGPHLQPAPCQAGPRPTGWPAPGEPTPHRPRAPGAEATAPPTGGAKGTGGQLHDVHEELTGVPHGLLEGLATACQLRGDSSQLPDRWPARWPTHHCVGLGQGVQRREPWGNG